MPESIDWPRMHPTRSRRRFFFLILAVLAVIVIGGRTALSYYVDVLWFESLGYGDVFWKTLARPPMGNFRCLCCGHISNSVRIVSSSEASASAQSAEWSHDFDRRTAAEAAG